METVTTLSADGWPRGWTLDTDPPQIKVTTCVTPAAAQALREVNSPARPSSVAAPHKPCSMEKAATPLNGRYYVYNRLVRPDQVFSNLLQEVLLQPGLKTDAILGLGADWSRPLACVARLARPAEPAQGAQVPVLPTGESMRKAA
jgi:hypothetical protein